MAQYLMFPGNGRVAPGEDIEYIDAPTLAALYGLEVDEYDIASVADFSGNNSSIAYINLVPRSDGLYRNIKIELGDNGTDYHWDTMVNADKHRRKGDNGYGVKRHSS
jgi:hypothetical protein